LGGRGREVVRSAGGQRDVGAQDGRVGVRAGCLSDPGCRRLVPQEGAQRESAPPGDEVADRGVDGRLRSEVPGDGTLDGREDLSPVVDVAIDEDRGEHLPDARRGAGERLAGDLPDLWGLTPTGGAVSVGHPDDEGVSRRRAAQRRDERRVKRYRQAAAVDRGEPSHSPA